MDALTPLSTSQTFIPPLGLLNGTLLCFYKPPLRGWIQSWIWAPLSLHKGLDSISSASMPHIGSPHALSCGTAGSSQAVCSESLYSLRNRWLFKTHLKFNGHHDRD